GGGRGGGGGRGRGGGGAGGGGRGAGVRAGWIGAHARRDQPARGGDQRGPLGGRGRDALVQRQRHQWKKCPPFTSSAWPVTTRDRSDAKNTTASAISAEGGMRFKLVRLAVSS